MTSRLKRKLGDMGVDTHSNKANENFCLIGTPLPPLEKSKDTGEFVPLWKQEVRDEKGRRRLHGAFTGGFSAGYFNTVGSKEGWAPSTFVSSRSDRAKHKAARPEDFMDEEDLQDIKDNKNIVDNTDEMDLVGRAAPQNEDDDSIASVLAATMSQPPKDSAGARILKKMGWKFGQGVGPRVSWRQRRLQDAQAGVITKLDDEDEEEASKHTYAPRDTPLLILPRKDNSHGLGYTPGLSLQQGAKKKSGPNISAGFGLGALNDADEDDLDVYDSSVRSGHNKMAYDIAHQDGEDSVILGKGKDRLAALSPRYLRDGKPVLTGFTLSDKPAAEDRWFPLPEVPSGWKPDPKRVWSNDPNKENARKFDPSQRRNITADERGDILGETPLPSAPRSVFDFMSKKDKERLQSIGEAAKSGSLPSQTPTAPVPTIFIPPIDAHVAQSALLGFQPFSTNPTRHARYTTYLRSHLAPPTAPPLEVLHKQSVEEFNREVEEYKKSAMLFKPISGAMAGRFTSGKVVEMGENVIEGLHTPTFAPEADGAKEAGVEQKGKGAKEAEPGAGAGENVPAKVHAASSGMYGPLTRETTPWQPAKLLCKRFGVKDPNPTIFADPTNPSSSSSTSSSSFVPTNSFSAPTSAPSQTTGLLAGVTFDTANDSSTFESASGATKKASSSSARRDLGNIGLGDDEEQGKDILTYERPSMDIFKAIFASDDEDSDGEEDAKSKEDKSGEAMSGIEPTLALPPPSTVSGPSRESSGPPPPTTTAPPPLPLSSEQVDLESFKPTFIPRHGKSDSKSKDKDKKDKKKKSSKSKSATVSFGMDEDGDEELQIKPSKDRPRKKHKSHREEKKQKRKEAEEDEEDVWVEKTQVSAAASAAAPPLCATQMQDVVSTNGVGEDAAAGPPRGRKRAVDFM